jgi:hypothetical protein
MPPSTSVTVRCTACGRIVAEYPRLVLDARRRSRLDSHARDLLEWHVAETRDCPAATAVIAEVARRAF